MHRNLLYKRYVCVNNDSRNDDICTLLIIKASRTNLCYFIQQHYSH